MTDKNPQMLEAHEQFMGLIRQSLSFFAGLLVIVLLGELWIDVRAPLFFLGALTGCVYALFNLWLLFSTLAPFFFHREKPLYVIYGAVISLGLGALLMFVSSYIGTRWSIGFALGVASPAIIGTLYSLRLLSTTVKT